MENTWVDNNSNLPIEAFENDFDHLKKIIENFIEKVPSDATTSATIEIEDGWSYEVAFPHGYEVVKEALCEPERVYFAGFYRKMSSEATEAAKDQLAQTEASLIIEVMASAPMCTRERILIIMPRNNFEPFSVVLILTFDLD